MAGSSFSNAALVGAKTTYGPPSRTLTMLTSGFSLPEMAALNVLNSGLFAIACEPVCSAIESMEPAPVGTLLR